MLPLRTKALTPKTEFFVRMFVLKGETILETLGLTLQGEIHRIAKVADLRTGLFPVEIRLANAARMLRPSMVATAEVVTTRIRSYQIPEAAVIFRHRKAQLFTVVENSLKMKMLYRQRIDVAIER